MPAQSGKAIVVSFKNDALPTPAYQVVGGLRTRSIAFNGETVDITHSESTGQWRELLEGVGVRSVTVSGSGIFVDDLAIEAVRDAYFDAKHRDASFLVPGFGTFEGKFQVTKLELSGEYNGSVQNSMTFESTGVITFAVAP